MGLQTQGIESATEIAKNDSKNHSFFNSLSNLAGKFWHAKERQPSESREDLSIASAREVVLRESHQEKKNLLARSIDFFLGKTKKNSEKFLTTQPLEKMDPTEKKPFFGKVERKMDKAQAELESAENSMENYTEEILNTRTGKMEKKMKSIPDVIRTAWNLEENGFLGSLKNVIFSIGGWFGAKYFFPLYKKISGIKNYFGEKLGFLKDKGGKLLNGAKKALHFNQKTKSTQFLLIESIKKLLKNPKSLEKQSAFKKLASKNPQKVKQVFKKIGISPDMFKKTYQKSTLRRVIKMVTDPEPDKSLGQSTLEIAPITGSYHDVKELWNPNSPLPTWAKVAIAGTSVILDAGLIASVYGSFGTATPLATSLNVGARVGIRKGIGILLKKIAPQKLAQTGGKLAIEEAGKAQLFDFAEKKVTQEIQNNIGTASLLKLLLQQEKLGKAGLLGELDDLQKLKIA